MIIKRVHLVSLLLLTLAVIVDGRPSDFGVKAYDDFHHVLHPLEHEALPKNDFATIRARAGELVKLGEGITKLGVPAGTKDYEDEADVINDTAPLIAGFH